MREAVAFVLSFLVGLCPLVSLMSRERRDLSRAFFTLGTSIMFLLRVSFGAQRWLDACGGLCPHVDTQGSLPRCVVSE